MTYKKVYQVISGVVLTPASGQTPATYIPAAYLQFPEDDPNNPAPPPPFICYYYTGDNDMKADDCNYQAIRQLTVELYCDNKNFILEQAVESALTSNGFVYSKTETYIDSEKMYMTTYETEVVITNG